MIILIFKFIVLINELRDNKSLIFALKEVEMTTLCEKPEKKKDKNKITWLLQAGRIC